MKRRTFLKLSASTIGVTGLSACVPSVELSNLLNASSDIFKHGVASGDPLQDRVILWSRVTLADESADITVPFEWFIAEDEDFDNIVAIGSATTNQHKDFTLKVDAAGLKPGNTYYYVFRVGENYSPIGRTRTLPDGHVNNLRIAMTSCSSYPHGHFNVYRAIKNHEDLDLVLHLGDYIYEYKNGEYGDGTALARIPMPDKEITTLDDYRMRHSQYKQDLDLQSLHQQHPMICIWDDHEIANDSWYGGAGNHNSENDEGYWFIRKSDAIQAYHEWMPIRENPIDREAIFRSFRFGDLIDLFMLDTRLYARDEQTKSLIVRNSDDRTLLGWDQEQWLYNGLDQSKQDNVRWRVCGQQVMIAQLPSNELPFNGDQWDGYPAARSRLQNHLIDNQIDNFVVLTGDIHSSWASDIATNPLLLWEYNPYNGNGSLGVEFVTPAVTSPGITDKTAATLASAAINTIASHIKWLDFYHRGFVLLDINHSRIQAEWHHIESIETVTENTTMNKSFVVNDGENHLSQGYAQTPSKPVQKGYAPSYNPSFTITA
ncbi:Phospholipase D [BD1-7 clade bacterium]|uniref:Phospholipase D n=1 Tax=BD1-7 clade bacterium TaxID=2029982 RepID=A0A5S9NP07_9GAMM|nr:Phospholipase D [BD1-7 clade bacterium]